MTSIKKKLFFVFLFSYFIIGSVNSVNTGISFDEKHEQLNWNFHVELLNNVSKKIISDKNFDKKKFDQEVQSFVGYGIGFQIISQPIQFILKDLLINSNNIDNFGAKLLAKHFVVFYIRNIFLSNIKKNY